MKKLEYGRSMIEMLGVLAIIGVLSVGAIAGYQKAMMKYKLNKQTQQIGSILDYVHVHLNEFKKDKVNIRGNMEALLTKLGIIPKEMVKKGRIYDVFGNQIILQNYFGESSDGMYFFELINLLNSNASEEICMNLFQIAKLRSSYLTRAVFNEYDSTERLVFTGDNYPYSSSSEGKHIKDASLADFKNACDACIKKSSGTCVFYFQEQL